jgi:hypothetical protein
MDISQIGRSDKAKLSSSTQIKKNKEFSQIFDRKMSEINATTPRTPIDIRANLLDHGDSILNLLDIYRRELTDPAKTLKDIEPLVAKIKKETSLIEAETADKVPNDALGGLIKDLVMTSNVAVLKFNRGDYI